MSQPTGPTLGPTVIALLKGVVERSEDGQRWQDLLNLQSQVRAYLGTIGLDLVVDETDGYAFVKQRAVGAEETPLPRLVPRRALSYPVSLLLVVLRKRMAENDALNGDPRLIMTRDEIGEALRLFLPATAAEDRFRTKLEQYLSQIEQLGFIRRLRGRDDAYEARRILRAFIDGQFLQDLATRLSEYHERSLGKKTESDA